MAKILITGGTGLIGKELTRLLLEQGYEVVLVSRRPVKGSVPTFLWNVNEMKIDESAFEGIDSIIHLAGAGIADKPWSESRKQEILESRTKSTALLKQTCDRLGIKLKSFISASAIGWYPLTISEDKLFAEDSPAGDGFLSMVCQKWEESADTFESIAEHVAKIRIGLVLSKDGGALPQMDFAVKLFIGAAIGKGTQAMPWIHINDIARMFCHVLENKLNGVYNGVGPENATNQEFMQTIADVLDKPMLLPNIPEFLVKLLFGAKADLITQGVRISSDKIKSTDFGYVYPTLNTALTQIYFG